MCTVLHTANTDNNNNNVAKRDNLQWTEKNNNYIMKTTTATARSWEQFEYFYFSAELIG